MVELLIGSGVETNARCKENITPLHAVVRESKRKVIEVLLSNGVDACAADKMDIHRYTVQLEEAW